MSNQSIARIECVHVNGQQDNDVTDRSTCAQVTVACAQSHNVLAHAHRVIHTQAIPKRTMELGKLGNWKMGNR